MDLAGQLRLQARANRLANHRLHAAMAALGDDEFHAPRVVFFRSLAATLNHVLAVDEYYIGALRGEANLPAHYRAFVACRDEFLMRSDAGLRVADRAALGWSEAEVYGAP